MPFPESQSLVSWTIFPPSSITFICPLYLVLDRLFHKPEGVDVLHLGAGTEFLLTTGLTETFASHLREPSSMLPSHTPRYLSIDLKLLHILGCLFRTANVGLGDDLHQGDAGPVQIHKAVIARAPSWMFLPASSSICILVMPILLAPPSVTISIKPCSQIGCSNWLI